MSNRSNKSPVMKIIRIGFAENDVIPSIDRLSILDNGYFVSPATRQARGYLTTDVSSPIAGIIPRKNRLLSPYSLSKCKARLLISLKSAWSNTVSRPIDFWKR